MWNHYLLQGSIKTRIMLSHTGRGSNSKSNTPVWWNLWLFQLPCFLCRTRAALWGPSPIFCLLPPNNDPIRWSPLPQHLWLQLCPGCHSDEQASPNAANGIHQTPGNPSETQVLIKGRPLYFSAWAQCVKWKKQKCASVTSLVTEMCCYPPTGQTCSQGV